MRYIFTYLEETESTDYSYFNNYLLEADLQPTQKWRRREEEENLKLCCKFNIVKDFINDIFDAFRVYSTKYMMCYQYISNYPWLSYVLKYIPVCVWVFVGVEVWREL